MPEGPEVFRFAAGLQPLVGQRVKRLSIAPYRKCPNPEAIVAHLTGSRVSSVEAYAKKMAIATDRGLIAVGAGMSGSWRIGQSCSPIKHDILRIECGAVTAVFNDVRRFGSIRGYRPDTVSWHAGIGPDALQPSILDQTNVEHFAERLSLTRAPIKPLLLDQSIIGGLGNIYASETCWAMGCSPSTPANHLTCDAYTLLTHIHHILTGAVRGGGSTIAGANPYRTPDGSPTNGFVLKVYGRDGWPCARCRSTVVKSTQAGRATYSCPVCQPVL